MTGFLWEVGDRVLEDGKIYIFILLSIYSFLDKQLSRLLYHFSKERVSLDGSTFWSMGVHFTCKMQNSDGMMISLGHRRASRRQRGGLTWQTLRSSNLLLDHTMPLPPLSYDYVTSCSCL